MTPREALNTSAVMLLAVSIMGPWGVPFGYGIGEVVNRALRKNSGPPSGGGTRLRRVGPPVVENSPDLKVVGGAR
jgi:hypothetical protein